VRLPPDIAALDAPELTIDARSGRVLWRDNRMLTAEGRVFDNNPETSALGLASLALTAGAERLVDDDIAGRSCVDRLSCPSFAGTRRLRWCEIEPIAAADLDGNFLYDRPDSDAADDDAFAEVQMFHHATRTLAYFRALGFDGLHVQPMPAVVNLRVPRVRSLCEGESSSAPLVPFENAAFVPRGAFVDVWPATDAVVFGQGAEIDYAYDGDVVAHELTHAAMASATEMGLLALDGAGLDVSMWAMHEGFADYFAAALVDDPEIAEYVGGAFLGEGKPLRSLRNVRRCPADLVGEEHEDALIFSGALWEIRNTLHVSRRAAFDRAAWTVVDSLGAVESFDSVATRLALESAVVLDSASANVVGEVLAQRGLLDCDARIVDRPLSTPRRRMYLRGAADFLVDRALPGPVQLRVGLEERAEYLEVIVDVIEPDVLGPAPEVTVLVKHDAPIVWNPASLEHDADTVVALRPGKGKRYEARIDAGFMPGVYYVQLANAGHNTFVGGVRVVAPGRDGCAVGGGAGGGAGLLLAALLWVVRYRSAR
jgi:hypothetical protein